MRSAWFATLLLFGVAVGAVQAQQPAGGEPATTRKASSASKKESKNSRSATPGRAKPAEVVEFTIPVEGGWKETSDEAWQSALEKAQVELLLFFQKRDPDFRWKPDGEYIRKNLVSETSDEEEVKDFKDKDPRLGWMHRVQLKLQVSRRDKEEILRRDRDYRRHLEDHQRKLIAEYRLYGMGRGFAVFVAVLAGIGGYIRLDELTKGYYTNWLRLATASFIGLVGAGLLLLV